MIMLSKSATNQLQELNTKPPKKVVRTLIDCSLASDFDGAKAEWELYGNVDRDSRDFKENCELCGAKLHKTNWVIQNPNTGAKLAIGSECIKRFIQFAGTASQADSNRFFSHAEKELKIVNELNTMFKEVVLDTLPLARQVNLFRAKLIKILESKGNYPMSCSYTSPDFLLIVQSIFKRESYTGNMLHKLWAIINEPDTLVIQRETKAFKEYKRIKEGETWKRKGRVTATTLARSSAFQTDYNYSESKWERTSSDQAIESKR